MVLVAVEALVVPLRPARVLVLLGILGGLLLPSLRRLAGLDRLVLLLRVALLGHRHNRGVNDLAAARNVARGLKMLAEALEQPVDQSGLRQRLTKQPDCGGIRHRVRELQIKKAHERQPVTDQVLGLLVREVVERLQHHDLELQDRIIGLAAGVALALLGLRLRHRLDVSAEILPSHYLLDRLQRIALGTDRLQSALNIEKTFLPHDSLAPSAHYRVRSPSQIRGELARGIFRGALSLKIYQNPQQRSSRKRAQRYRQIFCPCIDHPDLYSTPVPVLAKRCERSEASGPTMIAIGSIASIALLTIPAILLLTQNTA